MTSLLVNLTVESCGVCSLCHPTEDCPLINSGLKKIADKGLPQKAFLTIPEGLKSKQQKDGSFDIVCTQKLQKGVQFGPFDAPKVVNLNPDCAYKLPILKGTEILHYLDTTNLNKCNWMALVRFTEDDDSETRNTICYQLKSEIYFSVVKNVDPEECLVVAYSPGYRTLIKNCDNFVQVHLVTSQSQNPPVEVEIKRKDEQSPATLEDSSSLLSDDNNDETIIVESKANVSISTGIVARSLRPRFQNSALELQCNNEDFEISTINPGDIVDNKKKPGPKRKRRSLFPVLNLEKWTCKFCRKEIIAITDFAQHLIEHYKLSGTAKTEKNRVKQQTKKLEKTSYSCDICSKTKVFNTAEYIIRHLKLAHSTQKVEQYNSKEGLPAASSSTAVKKDRSKRKKRKVSQGEKTVQFVCEVCGASYSNYSSMKTHLNTHKEKRFICEECGKRFTRKDLLDDHYFVHQAPQFSCEICSKKLKTTKSWKVHMRMHSEVKPYICQTCGKGFNQKVNLLSHERGHFPDDKKYHCACDYPGCGKQFASKQYLKYHQEEHSGKEKYICPMCDQQFVRYWLLQGHKKTVHKNCFAVCEFCNPNIHFRYRHSLKRHLVKEHSDLENVWGVEGYLKKMLIIGEGSRPRVKKVKPKGDRVCQKVAPPPPIKLQRLSRTRLKKKNIQLETVPDSLVPIVAATVFNSVAPVPDLQPYGLSTTVSDSNPGLPTPLVAEKMPEDLEIETEVEVGEYEVEDNCEIFAEQKAGNSTVTYKTENMVLLQLDDDDSGRYVIAFTHDLK